MQTYRCQGIILQTLNFRDYDQIVTVFSEEIGLIKFIAKKGNASKRGLKSNPLTQAEFVYLKNQSELFNLRDITTLNHYLGIRQNLAHLDSACELMKALLVTQSLHKPAPDLYKLLLSYLENITKVSNPLILEASFRLKLLRHEGLLDLSPPFPPHEVEIMHELAFSRSYQTLNALPVCKEMNQKIKEFFTDTIRQQP